MTLADDDVVDIGLWLSAVVIVGQIEREKGRENELRRGNYYHQSQSGRDRRRSVRLHLTFSRKKFEHGLQEVGRP